MKEKSDILQAAIGPLHCLQPSGRWPATSVQGNMQAHVRGCYHGIVKVTCCHVAASPAVPQLEQLGRKIYSSLAASKAEWME